MCLLRHYHPSVARWAQLLLEGVSSPRCVPRTAVLMRGAPRTGKPIEYAGDPLKDFTLSAFLDRFVYARRART